MSDVSDVGNVGGWLLSLAIVWAVPLAACIVLILWATRKDRRESKVTGLLKRSEAQTQPLTPAPVPGVGVMLDSLIDGLGKQIARCTSLIPMRSRLGTIESRHLRYAEWLKRSVASDLEALRTLRNAESVVNGTPPPDAVPFLNATVVTAERNLTALSILGDWLERA